MGANTTILALSKEGATSDLIQGAGIGAVFAPSDIEGLTKYIYHVYQNGNTALHDTVSAVLKTYDRKKIVQELSKELHKICQHEG